MEWVNYKPYVVYCILSNVMICSAFFMLIHLYHAIHLYHVGIGFIGLDAIVYTFIFIWLVFYYCMHPCSLYFFKLEYDESVLTCSSCRDKVRLLSLFSDIMPRSMVKSLTILLFPISFVTGCGIFCLKFYFWVSCTHSRGNKYLCYHYCWVFY